MWKRRARRQHGELEGEGGGRETGERPTHVLVLLLGLLLLLFLLLLLVALVFGVRALGLGLVVRVARRLLAAAVGRLERDGRVADVALAREADALLADLDLDALAELLEVADDARKLAAREVDLGVVDRVGDAEVLLVDVHELHLVLADAVRLLGLEQEREDVLRLVGAERDRVRVGGALDDLLQRRERHAERPARRRRPSQQGRVERRERGSSGDAHVAVAAVLAEARLDEVERDERDVRVVHGLQLLRACTGARCTTRQRMLVPGGDEVRGEEWTHDALVRAVKVGVGDELLDGCGQARFTSAPKLD